MMINLKLLFVGLFFFFALAIPSYFLLSPNTHSGWFAIVLDNLDTFFAVIGILLIIRSFEQKWQSIYIVYAFIGFVIYSVGKSFYLGTTLDIQYIVTCSLGCLMAFPFLNRVKNENNA